MSKDKISMPSSSAGITRYFDEYRSKLEFKPQWVIVFVVFIIIIELILHKFGLNFIGLG